jgi:hypothetical protein
MANRGAKGEYQIWAVKSKASGVVKPLEFPIRMIRALMMPGSWAAVPASKASRACLPENLPAACQPSSTRTDMNNRGQKIARRGLDNAWGVRAMNRNWVMYRLIINCTKVLLCFKRSPGQCEE